MISADSNSICEQAQPHYYEYVCGELRERIPVEILAHIEKCRSCRAELGRLKTVLDESEEAAKNGGQTTAAAVTNLKLHFAYAGASVTCDKVKPFIPTFATSALEVRVPTPITVHIDKCQQCANDLEVIRQLNLTYRQLCRLGQIFADKHARETVGCSQAQADILPVAAMSFSETDAEVLRHFCTCPACREQLYQHRETVCTELPSNEGGQDRFSCEEVSAADIFDYCFPYGIDPANDQYAKFRPALTPHLRQCPTCLVKMQQLHRKVYDIADRHDSGVITCFTVKKEIKETTAAESEDLYADWPVKVEVLGEPRPEPEVVSGTTVSPRLSKPTAAKLSFRQLLKPAAVAAALVIGALLLLNVPVAKGMDLGQVYQALRRITNVHITTFHRREPNPTQQVWVSRTSNAKMLRTETECVLWDLENKTQKTKGLMTGSIVSAELDDDVLAAVKATMAGAFGLVPFSSLSEAPKGARWEQVVDKDIEFSTTNTQVYDLLWTQAKPDGSVVHNKWRGYIEAETRLLTTMEWWEKNAGDEEYNLLNIIKVSYPTAAEIKTLISEAGL
jgi:hypothetical protein